MIQAHGQIPMAAVVDGRATRWLAVLAMRGERYRLSRQLEGEIYSNYTWRSLRSNIQSHRFSAAGPYAGLTVSVHSGTIRSQHILTHTVLRSHRYLAI